MCMWGCMEREKGLGPKFWGWLQAWKSHHLPCYDTAASELWSWFSGGSSLWRSLWKRKNQNWNRLCVTHRVWWRRSHLTRQPCPSQQPRPSRGLCSKKECALLTIPIGGMKNKWQRTHWYIFQALQTPETGRAVKYSLTTPLDRWSLVISL